MIKLSPEEIEIGKQIFSDKEFVAMVIKTGIITNIEITTEEKPRHTSWGSTDRKGYTIQSLADFYGIKAFSIVEVSPWNNQEMVLDMIKNSEEKLKYEFADVIYREFLEKK